MRGTKFTTGKLWTWFFSIFLPENNLNPGAYCLNCKNPLNCKNLVFDDRRITKWLPLSDLAWCGREAQRMTSGGVPSEVIKSLPVSGHVQRCAVVRLDGELFGVSR